MGDLVLPKLNPNDVEYLLVEWLVDDGKPVRAGDPVAVVESSKAATELEADEDGPLNHAVTAGSWCAPGTVLARIGDPVQVVQPSVEVTTGPVITEPARLAMAELGVAEEQVVALGLKVVRRADVEGLSGRAVPLTRVQRAVGRAVSVSHQTIPAAYTVVRFDLTRALGRAAELTREVRRPVGIADLFVRALAGLHAEYPLFFAVLDGERALLSDVPHVGVTFDVGEGLYVPVVRDPGGLSPKELATLLMRYRLKAAQGGFTDEELTGATITLTLHTEPDVVLAIPFVFPGQVCALALPEPGQDGTADVGLAYDHRLVNGRDAALFLRALKNALEA